MNSIFESVNDAVDNVNDALDRLYCKQLMIMESGEESVDISEYQCFQEGFLFPRSKALEVYKFNNKHLLKAVKLFNKAYAEIPIEQYCPDFDEIKKVSERGSQAKLNDYDITYDQYMNIARAIETEFTKTDSYSNKALDELGKQFDCTYRIILNKSRTSTAPFMMKFPEGSDKKIALSKSKGFQLGKVNLSVYVSVFDLITLSPADRNLFGQWFTSILLHETFHNIVRILDRLNKEVSKDIENTLDSVAKSKNIVASTARITSLIGRIKKNLKIEDNAFDEKRTEKRFYILSQIKDNKAAVGKFSKDVKSNSDPVTEEEIEKYIDMLKKNYKSTRSKIFTAIKEFFLGIIAIIGGALGFAFAPGIGAGVSLGAGLGFIFMAFMDKQAESKAILGGMGTKLQEEYFCDLFASMYQLPVHLVSYNRYIAMSKLDSTKAKQIDMLENKTHSKMSDEHPNTIDREIVSYKMAKQILNSNKHLKKEVKEYLKYIVDLHDGIDNLPINDSKRRAKRLSPEASADLQETLTEFAKKNNVAVTESFIEEFCGGEYYGS